MNIFYLYEENGLISMIPWDYNLAYGGFQSNNASAAVNDAIDTPLSITENDTDRPAYDWIISNEEFKKEYHEYFKNFIDKMTFDNYLQSIIDKTYKLIYEYVENDPTKFCTMEEFELANATIKSFIDLRIKSIEGQLAGITTAKLAFKRNLKKQYEIKHSEMNLAKKLGGDLLPKYYYKWTPEFVISPYTFKAFLKTIEGYN